jgi:hypothetical protein
MEQVDRGAGPCPIADLPPLGWPEKFIAPDQTLPATLRLDGVSEGVAQAAAKRAARLVRDIDALAITLLDAARRLARVRGP